MSPLSWAATCAVKNRKIKHHARSLCCPICSFISYIRLHPYPPRSSHSDVLCFVQRSQALTCLKAWLLQFHLPSTRFLRPSYSWSPSLFRTQSNITSSEQDIERGFIVLCGIWENLLLYTQNN